ncbi:MAG: glutathione S-transferase family protein [Alphaproteobacteria bacterium]
MLTIHGRKTSVNVQVVMWLVGELGLEHRRLDVAGAFGGTDTPEFLAMNPNGLVPVLEDGTVTLFEAQAILRYLASVHGGDTIWPADPVARAPIDQWMEWGKTMFYPLAIQKVFWSIVRTRAVDRDEAKHAADIVALGTVARLLDRQLSRGAFVTGPELTLADITIGGQLYRYFTLDFERPDLANLKGYYDQLCARPAYATHVMVPYDDLYIE